MINKGDLVKYDGKVYEVLTAYKRSDVVVIQKREGDRRNIVYTWAWKCRKVV